MDLRDEPCEERLRLSAQKKIQFFYKSFITKGNKFILIKDYKGKQTPVTENLRSFPTRQQEESLSLKSSIYIKTLILFHCLRCLTTVAQLEKLPAT